MGTKKLTGFAAYLKENKSMPVPLEEDISVADLWMDDDFEDAFADVVATKARILYSELSKSIGKNDWMTPSKVLGDEKTFVSSVVNNTKDETFAKKTSQFKNMISDIEKENVRPTKEYYTKAMSKFLMESNRHTRLNEARNPAHEYFSMGSIWSLNTPREMSIDEDYPLNVMLEFNSSGAGSLHIKSPGRDYIHYDLSGRYVSDLKEVLNKGDSNSLNEAVNKEDLLQASDLTSGINQISKMSIADLEKVNTTSGGLKFDEADFQGFDIQNGTIVGIFKTKNDGRFSSDYFVIMNTEGELEGVSDY